MEPRSIQEGIEKAMEKWIASRWPKSRNKPLRGVAEPGVQSPGEVPPFEPGQSLGADGWSPWPLLGSKVMPSPDMSFKGL